LSKLVLNDDAPSVTLVRQLKQFEAQNVQVEKAIKLAAAQVQVVTIPPEVMEMKNELSTKLKDKEFRLRVREYIRGTVKAIKLDTHSDFTNYQVELKNDHVLSVVLWKQGKEDSEGVSFQVLRGVKRACDPEAVIFSST